MGHAYSKIFFDRQPRVKNTQKNGVHLKHIGGIQRKPSKENTLKSLQDSLPLTKTGPINKS